jgi:hypothetical protein
VRIISGAQLDDIGCCAHFLHGLPLAANAPPETGGCALPDWVGQIRSQLVAQDPSCDRDLDAALSAAGLDPVHHYDQTWLPGEPTIYGVTIGFPA